MVVGMLLRLVKRRVHGRLGDVVKGVEGGDGVAVDVGEVGVRKGVVGAMGGAHKTHGERCKVRLTRAGLLW